MAAVCFDAAGAGAAVGTGGTGGTGDGGNGSTMISGARVTATDGGGGLGAAGGGFTAQAESTSRTDSPLSARATRQSIVRIFGIGVGNPLNVAGDAAAAFDLNLGIADFALDISLAMDNQPRSRDQRAFEPAADFRHVDFNLTAKDSSFGNFNCAAIAKRRFDSALDDQGVAGGNFAGQADFAADDKLFALRIADRFGPLRTGNIDDAARHLQTAAGAGSGFRHCTSLSCRDRRRDGPPSSMRAKTRARPLTITAWFEI
jgi:hypothetical protein